MKKVLLLLVAVTALGTGVSYSVARWVASRRPAPAVFRVHDVAWLKRELRLDQTQATEVEKCSREFQIKLDGLCASHCAARFALGEELAKPKVDVEKAQACVEKMNQTAAEAERMTLAHILKVRALLSEEQAQRYSSAIHQQVCTMPMGAP